MATDGPGLRRDDLAEEAIRLATVLTGLMPDEAEPTGAARPDDAPPRPPGGPRRRRRARSCCWTTRTARSGTATPSTRRHALVERALRMRRPPGRFALQAAIAALHAEAPAADRRPTGRRSSRSTTSCARRAPSPGRGAQPRRRAGPGAGAGGGPGRSSTSWPAAARSAPTPPSRRPRRPAAPARPRRTRRPPSTPSRPRLDDNPAERAFLARAALQAAGPRRPRPRGRRSRARPPAARPRGPPRGHRARSSSWPSPSGGPGRRLQVLDVDVRVPERGGDLRDHARPVRDRHHQARRLGRAGVARPRAGGRGRRPRRPTKASSQSRSPRRSAASTSPRRPA